MMEASKNKLINNVIEKIKHEIKKDNSTEQFLDFAFNFQFDEFTLKPLQNKSEIHTFLKIIKKLKPKIIVEIGTANGGTLFLLTRVVDLNATIISIDLPEGEFGGEFYPRWKESIYNCFGDPNQKIHLIRENSHNVSTVNNLSKILKENEIDLLLIDGDHTFEGVKMDFELYRKFVSDNGIIAFHDINDGSNKNVQVREFWSDINKKYESFEIIFNNPGTGFGIGIVINQPKNDIISNIILKELDFAKNETIKKILNNPLSALISLYDQRIDLQNNFPEVKEGGFSRLIIWVADNLQNENSNEIDLKNYLGKFRSWYETYNKLHANSCKVENLERVVGEKNNNLKELEKVVGEKNNNLKELEKVVGQKESHIVEIEEILHHKTTDLNNLRNELSSKENELIYIKNNLTEIENSLLYKQMKKFVNTLDAAFPNNSKRGEFKKIVRESLRFISKNGFSEYISSIKTKIKRREFQIITPLEISKKDEENLLELVKKNKKNRLTIKGHQKKDLIKDTLSIPKDDKLA